MEEKFTGTFPTRQGYLFKQGAQVRNWKKRWFVLTKGALAYYVSPNAKSPKGIVPLDGDWTARKCDLKKRSFGLQFQSSQLWERFFTCSAESEEERTNWIRDVCATIAILRKNKQVSAPQRPISHSFTAPSKTRAPANSMRCVSTPDIKKINTKCDCPRVGVTIHELEKLLSAFFKVTTSLSATAKPTPKATTQDICFSVIYPITAQAKCSYAEVLMQQQQGSGGGGGGGGLGVATHFVSHAWKADFGALLESLNVFLVESNSKASETFFWLDIVALNQHATVEHPKDYWAYDLKTLISQIGHTVAVFSFDDIVPPTPLSRAWCLWELLCTIQSTSELHILLPTAQRNDLSVALLNDFGPTVNSVCLVDSASSHASFSYDFQMISSCITDSVGFSLLNEVIVGKLQDWLLDVALARLSSVPASANKSTPSLTALNDIASLLEQHARFDEALRLARRAEKMDPEGNHAQECTTLHIIAKALMGQGKYEDARGSLQQALELVRVKMGPRHALVGTILHSLAELASAQCRISEATLLYREALAVREESLGPVHVTVAATLNGLASSLRDQGMSEECVPLLERSLGILISTHGPVHPLVGLTYNNLAAVLREQGRCDEAVAASMKAIATLEKVHGCLHPLVAAALDILSGTLIDQGKLKEALPHVERCLTIAQKVYGRSHPQVASPLNNLGRLLFAQGRLDEALGMFQQSLAIFEDSVGNEHVFTGNVLTSIGMVMWKQKQFENAADRMQRSVSICAKHSGMQDPSTMQLLALLQMIQLKQACPM